MPTLISRSGNSSRKPTRLLEPTESLQTATMRSSSRASAMSVVGERLAAVVERGGRRRVAHRDSSSRAAWTCSAVGTLWCHSTRSSMNETPLPLIVLAITATGRPVVDGRERVAAAARSRGRRRRGPPSRSWPTCRRAARAAWCPRCGRPAAGGCGRRSRSGWRGRSGAAVIAASQLLPSCSSPSPSTTNVRRGEPCSCAASAQPTATGKPWPSGPVLVSTPGHLGAVRVAVERGQRRREGVQLLPRRRSRSGRAWRTARRRSGPC